MLDLHTSKTGASPRDPPHIRPLLLNTPAAVASYLPRTGSCLWIRSKRRAQSETIPSGLRECQPHQLSPAPRCAFTVSELRSTLYPGLSLRRPNPRSILGLIERQQLIHPSAPPGNGFTGHIIADRARPLALRPGMQLTAGIVIAYRQSEYIGHIGDAFRFKKSATVPEIRISEYRRLD